uniref:DNA-directed RNA polymerase n=1 Tax=Phthorimaea operculella granulovirus TaxID=192584 RepID=A0A481SBK0_9BBAC|nr:late expression factor 8 [Phthorimaea operculella granulovirus]QBH66736.1 late expression factor 8 [Phthorimaea operculella granulovirus]QBH66866.1 late expression factor 8 [Phthorimaea operculella granulovirus]QBH67125.1 late expression factor 8 [Phthorimaea operculella granulovirus]QBH67255.1 late expression factor 8 [Phthorimaea operculella granulovirus]
MGVIEDFNHLYNTLTNKYQLEFVLTCQDLEKKYTTLSQIKTYFCCALLDKKCVLHSCVVIILGTWLDKKFRCDESDFGFAGTFIHDGRHFSFPNIMMNNNVLVHNFFDKQYARDKRMKRIFLYGNYDDEKTVNRAIQLVYDKVDDILYVRDVYAKDYIVDSGINEILREYLKCSGKWSDMDFVFSFDDNTQLFDKLKCIMSVDIPYQIDSLSNKIIYKHAYLLELTYNNVLNKLSVRGKKNIAFPVESKKIYDTIVMGKLIQSVSKTLSKQKKYDQDYNSNNNNLEVYPLKYRIGNEVLRIINENMQQEMLKHTSDYVKFVDSFFHGEMTVAGKKFFLCHNTLLPNVDYKLSAQLFTQLIDNGVFHTNCDDLMVAFNNRPTKFYCNRDNLYTVYYTLKRRQSPIEIKVSNGILFVNHHEGMIMLKRVVCIDNNVRINTLQTPFEYHNENSLVNTDPALIFEENNTTCQLMSTMILEYYRNHLHIFNTIPVAKLIVSLTNLKNGMVVRHTGESGNLLPVGNSVLVDESIYCNDRMFYLWTLVMDIKLKTAEDPYVPHTNLPIRIFHNKVNRLKGRIEDVCTEIIYKQTEMPHNIIAVEGNNCLCLFGTLICSHKIAWNHDGKKYKIEYCTSKQWHVYKFYMYFRRVHGQTVHKVHSEMVCDDNNNVFVKLELVYTVNDLEGLKICGVHGQKGVLNSAEDLSEYVTKDGVHAQICLSPISYLSRQTNFDGMVVKTCTKNGKRYPLILIPYMFFNNTPDNIYKEFIGKNITGYEKVEGTRLDQWSINQSFMGNRLAEGLHCVRNGANTSQNSGQYNIFQTLLHCNNIKID